MLPVAPQDGMAEDTGSALLLPVCAQLSYSCDMGVFVSGSSIKSSSGRWGGQPGMAAQEEWAQGETHSAQGEGVIHLKTVTGGAWGRSHMVVWWEMRVWSCQKDRAVWWGEANSGSAWGPGTCAVWCEEEAAARDWSIEVVIGKPQTHTEAPWRGRNSQSPQQTSHGYLMISCQDLDARWRVYLIILYQ